MIAPAARTKVRDPQTHVGIAVLELVATGEPAAV
jgi:hypothetical protein